MKHIIYSIITALLLTVILSLLIPRWLFRGDARWTYQSDAARMDVRFKGHLKNAYVRAESVGLRVTQPAWLSNESYQGTVVEFPVSYRAKSYQVKLSPKADEWGEDAALVVELKGKDFRHKGKRRPAWVTFRNISLNGHPIATEQIVWHDRPFILPHPPLASEITLTFDVHKPLAIPDISFKNLSAVFLACLLLCLFFASLKKTANHVLTFTNQKDIVQVLLNSYRNIDPVYRHSFWIILGVLCFAFGFHTVQFMWGNHDWMLLESKQEWLGHAWEGRYMANSIKALLLGGMYLPLVHDLITFIALALNAVLLCKYWHLEKRVTYFVLCGLVLTVQPFTLSMLWYITMTPEVFIGVTYVLAALLLSEKVTSVEGSPTRKILYSLTAIVLINFALATYPVLINTIAVAFIGRLLIQSFDWDDFRQQQETYLRAFAISATNIILGVVLYISAITYVFPPINNYNTGVLPLNKVPERISTLLKQSVHQLYEYKYPFISQWILWVFLGFAILLALHICSRGSLRQKIVRLSFLFGSLFATQTAMIIAEEHIIDGRVELFGLVVFETLMMVLIIAQIRRLHNLSVLTGVCVICSSIIVDLDCLRVWKLGFDAEKMLWSRVLTRLETRNDFHYGRKYDLVQIGKPISTSLRPRYYTGPRGKFHDDARNLLNYSYDHNPRVFSPYEFYYPVRFINRRFSSVVTKKASKTDYEAQLKRLYQAGVLQKAEVWPKPNGLIVWKDIILFVTDGKALDNYKKRFERELGKK